MAFERIFASVEGGSLVVKLPDFAGTFEIGHRSHLLKTILTQGTYEPVLAEATKNFVNPDRDFIDVGANIGLFSVLAASLIASGRRVLAVEPTPGALHYLYRNISRNKLDTKIIVFEGVASHVRAPMTINVIPGMEEYSSLRDLVYPNLEQTQPARISVAAETLDHLVRQFKLRPGFIKIDAEGSEDDVLRGCVETLRDHRPIVIFEDWPESIMRESGGNPGAASELLAANGYVIQQCAPGNLLATPREAPGE
ncbi:MAG: FkbM family methyltransferase [Acidobacteriia bacterium]|nr:FkbM family methyltransferase [Terriglobia bacterium]